MDQSLDEDKILGQWVSQLHASSRGTYRFKPSGFIARFWRWVSTSCIRTLSWYFKPMSMPFCSYLPTHLLPSSSPLIYTSIIPVTLIFYHNILCLVDSFLLPPFNRNSIVGTKEFLPAWCPAHGSYWQCRGAVVGEFS